MELKLVRRDDAYPSDGNPREDFGDLEAMAATFSLNPANPGEPLNPPVLVRDGDVYRIVDGERRWRAMGIAGTKEFHAVVCEDWDDADAALAMLATDDKKELTEVERSRGAQRCLLLGVEPARVEKASRRKGMRSVQRVAGKLGAEAELMSIDHLIAIDELADYPDLAERVVNASEKTWKRAYDEAVAEIGRREAETALREAAQRLGLALEGDGADTNRMDYLLTCYTPEDLERAADECPKGTMFVFRGNGFYLPRVAAYAPGDEETDPEFQAAMERADAWLMRMEDAHGSATRHVAESLAGGTAECASTMAMAAERYLGEADAPWSERAKVAKFMGRFELEVPSTLGGPASGLLGIALLRRLADESAPLEGALMAAAGATVDGLGAPAASRIIRTCEYLAAAIEDGWGPAREDVELMEKLTGLAEAALAGGEE